MGVGEIAEVVLQELVEHALLDVGADLTADAGEQHGLAVSGKVGVPVARTLLDQQPAQQRWGSVGVRKNRAVDRSDHGRRMIAVAAPPIPPVLYQRRWSLTLLSSLPGLTRQSIILIKRLFF